MSDLVFANCLKALFIPFVKGDDEIQNDDASVLISIVEYFMEFPHVLSISEWLKLLECYWWLYDKCMHTIKDQLGDKYRKSVLEIYMIAVDLALLAKYSNELVYCEHFIWCAALFMNMWYPFMRDINNDISDEERKDFVITTRYFAKRTCPFSDMSTLNSLCTYERVDILGLMEIYLHPKSQVISLMLNEGGLSSMDFDRLVKSPIDSLTEFFVTTYNDFFDYDTDKELITPDERLDVEKCANVLRDHNVPSVENHGDILHIIRTYGLHETSGEDEEEEEEVNDTD